MIQPSPTKNGSNLQKRRFNQQKFWNGPSKLTPLVAATTCHGAVFDVINGKYLSNSKSLKMLSCWQQRMPKKDIHHSPSFHLPLISRFSFPGTPAPRFRAAFTSSQRQNKVITPCAVFSVVTKSENSSGCLLPMSLYGHGNISWSTGFPQCASNMVQAIKPEWGVVLWWPLGYRSMSYGVYHWLITRVRVFTNNR